MTELSDRQEQSGSISTGAQSTNAIECIAVVLHGIREAEGEWLKIEAPLSLMLKEAPLFRVNLASGGPFNWFGGTWYGGNPHYVRNRAAEELSIHLAHFKESYSGARQYLKIPCSTSARLSAAAVRRQVKNQVYFPGDIAPLLKTIRNLLCSPVRNMLHHLIAHSKTPLGAARRGTSAASFIRCLAKRTISSTTTGYVILPSCMKAWQISSSARRSLRPAKPLVLMRLKVFSKATSSQQTSTRVRSSFWITPWNTSIFPKICAGEFLLASQPDAPGARSK